MAARTTRQPDPTTPVTAYRFGPHDKVTIAGVDYMHDRAGERGHAFRRVDAEDIVTDFSHEELQALQRDGAIDVQYGYFRAGAARTRARMGNDLRLTELAEAERLRIVIREAFCRRFMALEANDPTVSRTPAKVAAAIRRIAPAVRNDLTRRKARQRWDQVADTFGEPSPSALLCWLRAFEDSGYEPASLSSRYRNSGNRTPRKDGDSVAFAKEHARTYADLRRPTMTQVYRRYLAALAEENHARAAGDRPALETVSQPTFNGYIKASASPYHMAIAREGREAAARKLRMIRGDLVVQEPLERVEMDEWQVDIQVLLTNVGLWPRMTKEQRAAVRRSRPWLTAVVDCATRCLLALRLSDQPPSTESALAALEMAVFDKENVRQAAGTRTSWEMHGVPATVAMDSGAGFVAMETRNAINALGATAFYPPAGIPGLRARIERIFGTMSRDFAQNFDGQTFGNIFIRGDYDAEGRACLDLQELNETLINWAVDQYHNTPHSGLGHETPREAWRRLTRQFPVRMPPPPHLRREIFGVPYERQLGREGVKVLGIRYVSADLQALLHAEGPCRVTVKLDRLDLGEVSVRHGKEGSWLSARPLIGAQELRGVSIWEWTAAASALRRENADRAALGAEAVFAAVRRLQGTAEMARKRADIGAPILTAADLARIERATFRDFDYRQDGGDPTAGSDDALGLVHLPPAGPEPAPRNPRHHGAGDGGFGAPDQFHTEE